MTALTWSTEVKGRGSVLMGGGRDLDTPGRVYEAGRWAGNA